MVRLTAPKNNAVTPARAEISAVILVKQLTFNAEHYFFISVYILFFVDKCHCASRVPTKIPL